MQKKALYLHIVTQKHEKSDRKGKSGTSSQK